MDIEKLKYEAQNKALHIADVSGSALFNADCMDILPLIPDKSVQLILADLPFNTKKGTTWNEWDKEIDLSFTMGTIMIGIITDNGCNFFWVWFVCPPISTIFKKYKYDLIWQKQRNWFLNCNRMPLSDFENILVFYNKTMHL